MRLLQLRPYHSFNEHKAVELPLTLSKIRPRICIDIGCGTPVYQIPVITYSGIETSRRQSNLFTGPTAFVPALM
ncbi:MAG: hypothetical protein IPM04_19895 [Saprospiraceae bacterium]|nr:hypothetical protein [Candidatus Brachybacter algidus]MBK8749997.1 hypothetical protein [Candidatus Brachybacter algidus]